jgi:hypothetical protein
MHRSSPPTTRCSAGTTVIMRNRRNTRSARSTENAAVAGASATPTTVMSKIFQPSRKKARPCTAKRAKISITKMAMIKRSMVFNSGP